MEPFKLKRRVEIRSTMNESGIENLYTMAGGMVALTLRFCANCNRCGCEGQYTIFIFTGQ